MRFRGTSLVSGMISYMKLLNLSQTIDVELEQPLTIPVIPEVCEIGRKQFAFS